MPASGSPPAVSPAPAFEPAPAPPPAPATPAAPPAPASGAIMPAVLFAIAPAMPLLGLPAMASGSSDVHAAASTTVIVRRRNMDRRLRRERFTGFVYRRSPLRAIAPHGQALSAG